MIVVAETYDARTALVVVDVQNDIADPSGSLAVPGAEDIVDSVNHEIEAALDGATVMYTQDWHPPTQHTALRDGRRDVAGALRPWHLGRRSSIPSCASKGRRCGREPAVKTGAPA